MGLSIRSLCSSRTAEVYSIVMSKESKWTDVFHRNGNMPKYVDINTFHNI